MQEKFELQLFSNPKFGKIQMILIDGKPYAAAAAAAKILGYSNPNDAISRHCKHIVKHEGVSFSTNQYGKTTEQRLMMNFIPEGDLFRLIVNSTMPKAQEIEEWIFDEVIPSIVRTGSYTLTESEKFLQLAQNAVALEREVKEVQAQTANNTAELKEIKAQLEKTNFILPETTEAFDEPFVKPTSLYTTTEIGKAFGIGAQAVNRYLCKQGVVSPDRHGWKLNSQYVDCNYVYQKTGKFKMYNGKREEHLMTWWTATGKDFLCTVLSKAGLKQKRQVHPYDRHAKKKRRRHEIKQPSLFIVESDNKEKGGDSND